MKLVRDKGESFNFSRYREYCDFRNKNEKFEAGLTTNKDIIYDRNYFLEYAHNEFLEGNKLAGKKYKKHQEARKLEEEEKVKKFKQTAEELKDTIILEEKERFYDIVFINFVNAVLEDQSTPTKEAYYTYKAQVLATIDESLLQEEEANYKLALAEQAQGEGEGEGEG